MESFICLILYNLYKCKVLIHILDRLYTPNVRLISTDGEWEQGWTFVCVDIEFI